MTERTPEPWEVLPDIDGRGFLVKGPRVLVPLQEDANLIAAAPDLEKALEAVDHYTTRTLEMHPGAEVDESWRAVEKQIRAALAKARGM